MKDNLEFNLGDSLKGVAITAAAVHLQLIFFTSFSVFCPNKKKFALNAG
jgi:hypothetical protein